MLAVAEELHVDTLNQVKLTLMKGLDRKIRALYSSQLAAEEDLEIAQQRLSMLRSARLDQFSIPWLLQLADKIGAHITLSIE